MIEENSNVFQWFCFVYVCVIFINLFVYNLILNFDLDVLVEPKWNSSIETISSTKYTQRELIR